MTDTLKGMAENYEKLHRLQMIEIILREMHSYVHNVVTRIEEDFDCCEDFEEYVFDDYITESVVKNTKENMATLGKYVGAKSYGDLFKSYTEKM